MTDLIRDMRAAIEAGRVTDASADATLVAPPATREAVAEAERTLGFALPRTYVELITSIGDGGFGPGFGLYGIGSTTAENEFSALSAGELVGPAELTLLWEWGSGVWALADSVTETLFITHGEYLIDSGRRFGWVLDRWARGGDLWALLFEESKIEGTNPFTGEPHVLVSRGRPFGDIRYDLVPDVPEVPAANYGANHVPPEARAMTECAQPVAGARIATRPEPKQLTGCTGPSDGADGRDG